MKTTPFKYGKTLTKIMLFIFSKDWYWDFNKPLSYNARNAKLDKVNKICIPLPSNSTSKIYVTGNTHV